jgi:hypothetical protein
MERPRINGRRQFPKGMRVCRKLQSQLASSVPFDPKDFTYPPFGKDLRAYPSHQGGSSTDSRSTIRFTPADRVRTRAHWIRFPSPWNRAISFAIAIDQRHDTSHLLPSSGSSATPRVRAVLHPARFRCTISGARLRAKRLLLCPRAHWSDVDS